eukprot:622101-Pelagomonas_calceolata.AAC.1
MCTLQNARVLHHEDPRNSCSVFMLLSCCRCLGKVGGFAKTTVFCREGPTTIALLHCCAVTVAQSLPWKGEHGVALDHALHGVVQEFGKGEEVRV